MATKKIIYIASTHNDCKTIYGGTLEYLLNNVLVTNLNVVIPGTKRFLVIPNQRNLW